MVQEMCADTCSVCVGEIGKINIVEVAGEVDVATVSLLAKALSNAVQSGKGDVILDANQLTYVDSAGLQTLISTHQKLATKDRRMVIVGCHGIFHKLMKMSQLDRRIPMYSNLEEALAALGSD